MQTKPWVAVLSQSMMKLFERDIDTDELRYIQTVYNNDTHGLEHKGEIHENAVETFARFIVKTLESERTHDSFSSLTVIAEPRFLGRVRKSMSADLERTVARWIAKDLEKATTDTIADRVLRMIEAERADTKNEMN